MGVGAGVVDGHRDDAEAAAGVGEERCYLRGIARVADEGIDRFGAPCGCCDVTGGCVEAILLSRADDDVCPLADKGLCDGRTDAAAPARDDRNLAFESA